MAQIEPLNIFSLIRTCANPSSVQNRKENEFDKISTLGKYGVQNLVQEAVNLTLNELAIPWEAEDRESFYALSLESFLKVLDNDSNMKESISILAMEMVKMREKYQSNPTKNNTSRETLPHKSEESPPPDIMEINEDFYSDLPSRVATLLRASSRERGLSARALQAINDWLHEEREKIFEEARSEKDDRIQLLKQRITKLSAILKDRETQLASALSDDVETGVVSEFRSVQGLNTNTPNYEYKKAMLQEIFNLNKDLREMAVRPE